MVQLIQLIQKKVYSVIKYGSDAFTLQEDRTIGVHVSKSGELDVQAIYFSRIIKNTNFYW